MQAFEWSKLIHEGVRPWGNPMGAAQFGSTFFMITGFHGFHVSCRCDLPARRSPTRCGRGTTTVTGNYPARGDRRACTGTSWTWSGSLSSRCSISGEAGHGIDSHRSRSGHRTLVAWRAGPSDRPVPEGLDPVVHPVHDVVHGGLLPRARLPALGADPDLHGAEGGADRRRVHAHGVGAHGTDLRHPAAAAVPAGAGMADGGRGRLHVPDAGVFFK